MSDLDLVSSLDELEELYTRNMITYSQYMNLKSKLEKKKYKYVFHEKTYIVSMTDEERRRFERIYKTYLEPMEEDNE